MPEMKLRILCPSKGRADRVMTTRFVPSLILVVPHGEGSAYKEHNPNQEILETPKGLRGITATKQWFLETFDEWFSIDDDIMGIRMWYEPDIDEAWVTDPQVIMDIILRVRNIAREMGAFMYGFSHKRRPVHYKSHQPFQFTGYMNSSHFGILKGHKLWYNLEMDEAEDHWLSCLNAYVHRYFLIDTRYSFITKDNFTADGGCNDYRTEESMKRNTLILRRTFGDSVVLKSAAPSKSRVQQYERSIKIPY